ncbi:Hypothetical protein LUCI_2259 [Lucifera butyrica]|uniref:DUF2520 domain-containing protein n=1 Tax=Lucifera butyrica TaxID=1351585 RepID=A0A498R7R7_9FIRM|nr:DUF2520 domain-containing protein [Lucifera butyrica]VBB07015.1 Hypothetical protein LUCI_2259 [Lucifera butyrica]
MPKKSIALVGAGKVGSVLAVLLKDRGFELTGVVSRQEESARRLGERLAVTWSTAPGDIIRQADIVLLTVPDRLIGEVAATTARSGAFRAKQVVLHTCGSLTAAILAPAKADGAFTGSLHPLQSFAAADVVPGALEGVYFALDGDPEAVTAAEELVNALGGQSFFVPPSERALYHAGACILSNYLVALAHWATGLYARFGLTRTEAWRALRPLLTGTVENIDCLGVPAALTGPASRGDLSTIARHLTALDDMDTGNCELYCRLGLYTAEIGREAGRITKIQAAAMGDLFEDRLNGGNKNETNHNGDHPGP